MQVFGYTIRPALEMLGMALVAGSSGRCLRSTCFTLAVLQPRLQNLTKCCVIRIRPSDLFIQFKVGDCDPILFIARAGIADYLRAFISGIVVPAIHQLSFLPAKPPRPTPFSIAFSSLSGCGVAELDYIPD